MRRIFLSFILFFIPTLLFFAGSPIEKEKEIVFSKTHCHNTTDEWQNLYNEMKLDSIISPDAFQQAINGYHMIKQKKREFLTLIDFSKASTEKRLFVLDMKNHKILFSSLVSHGKNSGEVYATSFSNRSGSYKSSLGFYLTQETYYGSNGYSLRLAGLEKGINDNARARAIVVHGAPYANPSVARNGRLGRSFGCPAIPQALTKPIIDTIKNGSVMFIYAPTYITQSTILQNKNIL